MTLADKLKPETLTINGMTLNIDTLPISDGYASTVPAGMSQNPILETSYRFYIPERGNSEFRDLHGNLFNAGCSHMTYTKSSGDTHSGECVITQLEYANGSGGATLWLTMLQNRLEQEAVG